MKRALAILFAVFALGTSFAQTKFPLQIVCNVMDADVYINNKLYTKTVPNLVIQLPPSTYSIKIAKAGYNEFSANVAVASGGSTLSATLQPLSAPAQTPQPTGLIPQFPLNITSNVQGANIYLSTKFMGVAPLGVNVMRGDYDVLVQAPGYADFTQRIQVRGNQSVNANLQPMMVNFTINLPAANLNSVPGNSPYNLIQVFMDSVQLQVNGSGVYAGAVVPGNHTIKIVAGGLKLENVVNIQSGKNWAFEPAFGLTTR